MQKKKKKKMKKGGSIKDSIKGKKKRKKKKCIKIKQATLRLFLAVLGPPFCVAFGLFRVLVKVQGRGWRGR